MPELPEVQTVVNTLAPRLVGATIKAVVLNRTDIVSPLTTDLAAQITRRTISAITRRAKRIVFVLDDSNQFFIHLGMTGRLTIETADREMAKHTHLILELASASNGSTIQLRFRDPRRFGGVFWLGKENPDENIGPEPLTLDPNDLATRLKKTTRFIKSALLDQSLVAGLGNIYVDEALHDAGIYPKKRANRLTLDDARRLTKSIKTVLRRALKHRGSTLRDYVDADGESGGFQKLHRVYDRKGKPCLKCGSEIRRIVIGGRSTHFCPKCQPRGNRSKKVNAKRPRGQVKKRETAS